jgi:hypothetical protein
MRTIKTLPTLILAASISAGMMLVPEAAVARGNGNNGNNGQHEQHSDHQDRNGMRNESNRMRSGNRPAASQTSTLREIRTGNGGKWRASRSGKPPKDQVIGKKPLTPADGKPPFVVTRGGNPPRGPVATTTAPPKGLPPGTATVSNGRVKLYIPNSTYGLTVTKNPSGTITVSNGDPTRR